MISRPHIEIFFCLEERLDFWFSYSESEEFACSSEDSSQPWFASAFFKDFPVTSDPYYGRHVGVRAHFSSVCMRERDRRGRENCSFEVVLETTVHRTPSLFL